MYDECGACYPKSASHGAIGTHVRLRAGCFITGGALADAATGKIVRVDPALPGTRPYEVEGPNGEKSWYPGDELVFAPPSLPPAAEAVGMRAYRGRDWPQQFAGQDEAGGRREGGTVIAPFTSPGWIVVQWDSGSARPYRWGADGAFDVDLVVGRAYRFPVGATVRLNPASSRVDGVLGGPASGVTGIVFADDRDERPYLVKTRGGAGSYYGARGHGWRTCGAHALRRPRVSPVGARGAADAPSPRLMAAPQSPRRLRRPRRGLAAARRHACVPGAAVALGVAGRQVRRHRRRHRLRRQRHRRREVAQRLFRQLSLGEHRQVGARV